MRAIILAGGKGTRLVPYTTVIQKPLVPIGGKMPILEVVLRQLKANGFEHITVTVNHLAHLIRAFFGDGLQWGLKIDYSQEDRPLGTIGPLTLIRDLPENFLVMNGDLICDLNFKEFFDFHCAGGNDVTVAACRRHQKIDFGVLSFDDNNQLVSFSEKPEYKFDVSMGIYCFNRRIIRELKVGEPYGFDNLMIERLEAKKKTNIFPFDGLWYDIGRPSDYDDVNSNFEKIQGFAGLKLDL